MSGDARVTRRAAILGLIATSGVMVADYTHARGREITGGRLAFRIPWQTSVLDPHRTDDVTCAILGDAIFEPLYAPSAGEGVVPVLAESDPEIVENSVRVVIRSGVRTAHGKLFAAKDAAFSIARARANGAGAWLTELPVPKIDGDALVFAARDPHKIVRALSSPLVAMVPLGFRSEAPDGTGPFRVERTSDGLAFTRNPRAASGPAFLEAMTVKRAPDLASSLRSFEGAEDDLGWLGAGFHEPRPGSLRFDAGPVAFALLRTGHDAGSWDSPGVAQSLADGIAPSRLGHLGVGAAWASDGNAKWGGGATAILVRDDSPWLIELARAVAAALTSQASEVSVHPVPAQEIADRRGARSYALMVDAVRPFGRGGAAEFSALASTEDNARAADIVRHPPRGENSIRVLARTLRVGILGEIRVSGGRVPDVHIDVSARAPGVDWGAVHRARTRSPA